LNDGTLMIRSGWPSGHAWATTFLAASGSVPSPRGAPDSTQWTSVRISSAVRFLVSEKWPTFGSAL
jgi:hypothetical protein